MTNASSALLVRTWPHVVLALCFLSGFSGLLYEVAWARMLHLLFGDTVLAVSTVLAAFMAGLALGSFWIGRSIDRRPRVLAVYAGLEVGIGLSALLFPVVLESLTPLYVWLHQSLLSSFWLFSVVRFVLALALFCVPTALMGATLPVLSRYLVHGSGTLGWRVGVLYGVNTGGAVIGCFLAGFLLIGSIGLTRTVWIGAGLNFVIALVAWAGQRWIATAGTPLAAPPGAPLIASPAAPDARSGTPPPAPPLYDRKIVRRVLAAFALAGAAALSDEVIWTRASRSSSATRRTPSARC